MAGKVVSPLSALTYDNLHLRCVVVQGQIRELQRQMAQLQQQGLAHLAAMRAEVEADPRAEYNPMTKAFVPGPPIQPAGSVKKQPSPRAKSR